jgi:hypothetical protein
MLSAAPALIVTGTAPLPGLSTPPAKEKGPIPKAATPATSPEKADETAALRIARDILTKTERAKRGRNKNVDQVHSDIVSLVKCVETTTRSFENISQAIALMAAAMTQHPSQK